MFKKDKKKIPEDSPEMQELGFVYWVLLRAFDGTVTATEAMELIRDALGR